MIVVIGEGLDDHAPLDAGGDQPIIGGVAGVSAGHDDGIASRHAHVVAAFILPVAPIIGQPKVAVGSGENGMVRLNGVDRLHIGTDFLESDAALGCQLADAPDRGVGEIPHFHDQSGFVVRHLGYDYIPKFALHRRAAFGRDNDQVPLGA